MRGWEIVALATIGVRGNDSMMFQIHETYISAFQAASMGVPWLPVETDGVEELEILDLERALTGKNNNKTVFDSIWPTKVERPPDIQIIDSDLKFDAIVSGALRSDYQKTRIEMMCERLNVKSFSPLWHKNSKDHMNALVEHGFEVKFVSVSSEGLDSTWLGKSLDSDNILVLNELSKKFRFNLDGEGGEFETITVDGPHMKYRLNCKGISSFKSGRGKWDIHTVDI